MTTKYTLDDVPMILNGISWQLKRIADSLEKQPTEKPKDNLKVDFIPLKVVKKSSDTVKPRDIRHLLKALNPPEE